MRNVIVFAVESARFAVELRWVREILTMGHVTPVPGAPRHIVGAINVRGVITPVIDAGVLADEERALERMPDIESASQAAHAARDRSAVLLDVDDTAVALYAVNVDEVVTAEDSPRAAKDLCGGAVAGQIVDSKGEDVRLIDPSELVRISLALAHELAARHPAMAGGAYDP